MKPAVTVLGLLMAGMPVYAEGPLPTLSGALAIGGKGGWDYVTADASTHLLYVSHESRMHVIDPAARKVVAEIPDTPGVHGIALAPEFNRGFITCGKDNSLVVIDLKTSRTVARLAQIGTKPDAVTFDPFSKRVFVMNNGGDNLPVVDAQTQQVIGSIPVGGAPESAQSDLKGRLFVNVEDKNQVKVIDTQSLKVLATWSLAPHATPTGMAIDVENHRLFVGCRSKKLVVLDLGTGAIVATVPIGAGVDACAFDPATRHVFASCKDGTVTVLHADSADTYAMVGSLRTEPGSKTMTLDVSTHKLYVPAAGAAGTPGDAKAGFQLLEYNQ
jgi:YVTN family beta-propeller protein